MRHLLIIFSLNFLFGQYKISPSELVDLSISTLVLDVSEEAQELWVDYSVIDDISGVNHNHSCPFLA